MPRRVPRREPRFPFRSSRDWACEGTRPAVARDAGLQRRCSETTTTMGLRATLKFMGKNLSSSRTGSEISHQRTCLIILHFGNQETHGTTATPTLMLTRLTSLSTRLSCRGGGAAGPTAVCPQRPGVATPHRSPNHCRAPVQTRQPPNTVTCPSSLTTVIKYFEFRVHSVK